jgi:hypothetical protein
MSSDTLFHGLRTSHGTESFFFLIGTYLFLFSPHMTGLRLATGGLYPAPFFIGAPRPSVGAPGHGRPLEHLGIGWIIGWFLLILGYHFEPYFIFFFATVAPVLFLFYLFLSRPCLFQVSQ